MWVMWMGWAALAADRWTLDEDASAVVARLGLHDSRLAQSTGHLAHAVRLTRMSGTLQTNDAGAPTEAKVEGVVASLRSGSEVRKAAGLRGALEGRPLQVLMDCVFNQLQPEQDNTLVFTLTGMNPESTPPSAKGRFRMRGTERDVELPLTVSREGDTLGAEGTLTLKLPDYGFRIPDSGWTVVDEATVTLTLVFRHAGVVEPPPAAPPVAP